MPAAIRLLCRLGQIVAVSLSPYTVGLHAGSLTAIPIGDAKVKYGNNVSSRCVWVPTVAKCKLAFVCHPFGTSKDNPRTFSHRLRVSIAAHALGNRLTKEVKEYSQVA